MAVEVGAPRARVRRRRWLRRLGGLLVALLGLAVAAAYTLLWRPLPRLDGTVQLAGLQAPVRVVRDAYGVPHIYAENLHDLFLAQGYVQAQDRLWQMDVSRRLASGRLAEVVGEAGLETDRLFRTVGLRRAAEDEWNTALSDEARSALTAFADGVNAYIEERRGNLPLEFRLLGYEPEPWHPVDSLAIGKYMAWYLGGNFTQELFRAALLRRVGVALAADLLPQAEVPGPTITGEAVTAAGEAAGRLLALLSAGPWPVAPDPRAGSNNWVVSGELTDTGRPYLANDPHLGVGAPAIWHQVHLSAPDLDAVGVTFPGVPGVVVGHNERIAWGVTNLGPDVQDLYVEFRHPEDPYRFLYQGTYERARVIREEIRVKGREEPVVLDVVVTRHGPVISDVVTPETGEGVAPGYPLALRWTALEAHGAFDTFLRIARAADWEDFRAALARFPAPGQNFVYADVDGNIGYSASGLVPIRASGDGLQPVPGWTASYEWTGFVPFEELPFLYNPPRGVIWTANNRPAGLDYPHFLGADFALPYRAQRIGEVLLGPDAAAAPPQARVQRTRPLTLDDMTALQNDTYDVQARELVPALRPALAAVGERAEAAGVRPEVAAEAARLLRVWAEEPYDAADSPGPLIYHTFFEHLLERTFRPRMGDALYESFLKVGEPTESLDRLIRFHPGSAWFDDPATDARETLEDAAAAAFVSAVAELVDRHGPEPARWRWGDVHRITFDHPLAVVPPLARLLNVGPFPYGGSSHSVGNASFSWGEGDGYAVTVAGVWRQVVDVGDWDRSVDVVGPGQSGHRLSAHYRDQAALWLEGRYHPQLFSRDAVERAIRHELLLVPRSD